MKVGFLSGKGDILAKKPRIRKSAPTVRELAVKAQQEPKPSRLSNLRAKAAARVPKPKTPSNKATRTLKAALGLIAKLLRPLAPRYFVNAWREVRQVTWPSRRETWRLTGAVFVFAALFGAIVAVTDKGLDELFKKLVLK